MVAATSQAQSRPATPTPAAAASAQATAPARAVPNVSVLIVEQEGYTRTLVSTVARALGIEQIVTANGAKAALKIADEAKITLVVCDLELPEMSGLEFLAELRRKAPHVQFLLISNQSDPEHIQEAVNSGVSAILVRPFSRAQVEAKLRYLVHRIAPSLASLSAARHHA
ncbi:MAG TPA: response regulator [Alphaproteobacteria bacterium]|nr:response regulator [Alphaproteobacteria bacterium]